MWTWFSAVDAAADYKDDIGYTRLSSELVGNMPNGAGVHVTHVEALSNDKWMPNTASGEFVGKTFYDKSTEHPEGYSGHANGVGTLFYGNTSSMAPGITDIDAYVAGYDDASPNWPPPPWQWLFRGFLVPGLQDVHPLYDMPESPNCFSDNLASPSRVANHSWVGSCTTSDFLRKVDWVIETDEYIQAVASLSGRPLLSSAFNVIAVGRTSGESPSGSAGVDSVYAAGRPRPHIVAPMSNPSQATPVVASAIALLVEVGRNPALSTDPVEQWTTNRDGEAIYNGERSEVIKAALMAGADRFTQNTSTTDDIVDYGDPAYQTDNGLDGRFGAGQVNVYNSYHIIAAGEQNSDEIGSGIVGWRGFDFDPSFGVVGGSPETASYYFRCDDAHCRLAASLVWNIKISGGPCLYFNYAATLYNLNLYLYDVTNPEDPQLVASSTSSVENDENLWVALHKNTDYEIRVEAADGQGNFNWDYALAWQVTSIPPSVPAISPLSLALAGLCLVGLGAIWRKKWS